MSDEAKAAPTIGVEITSDPYAMDGSPHDIKVHPEGYRLYWCNPNYRERRGWQGWEPVEYDDEIGRNLDQYLNDPPLKMEGTKRFDNYVRRGADAVLCKLPIGIWNARLEKKQEKANRHLYAGANRKNKVFKEGVSTYGDGLVDSKRPKGGFKSSANTEVDAPPTGDLSIRRRLFRDKGE